MKVTIRLDKTFERLAEDEKAKYLNKGDIFLPDGTGWEYEVVRKVMKQEKGEYELDIAVKSMSRGALKYAKAKWVEWNTNCRNKNQVI